MIINFSPISIPLPEVYLTADETEILLQCEEKGELDATIYKPQLLRSISTASQSLCTKNGKLTAISASITATANFSK